MFLFSTKSKVKKGPFFCGPVEDQGPRPVLDSAVRCIAKFAVQVFSAEISFRTHTLYTPRAKVHAFRRNGFIRLRSIQRVPKITLQFP